MKEPLTHAIKKVTLELIYQVVDERTSEILEEIKSIKKRQEEDFRYLNDKIDTQIGQVRGEIGQVRNEISQLNQRIDTVIQLLINIKEK